MECGGCTLCCELLDVPWMNSPAGHVCKECKLNEGCEIYKSTITRDCMDYKCAYNQMENVSINLRPDKCGVIFEKLTNDLFLGTTRDRLVLTKDLEEQIKLFNREGFTVVMHNLKGQRTIYKAEQHTREYIEKELTEVIKKWQHRLIHQT